MGPRLRAAKRCVGRRLGRFGYVGTDLLVDQLDQLRAEPEGAIEGLAVGLVRRVFGSMVVGGPVERTPTGHRDRREAAGAGRVGVAGVTGGHRAHAIAPVAGVLLGQLGAQPYEPWMLLERYERSLLR